MGFDFLEFSIVGIIAFLLLFLFSLTFALSFLESSNNSFNEDNNNTTTINNNNDNVDNDNRECMEQIQNNTSKLPKFTLGSVQIVFRNDLILLSGENSYSCPWSSRPICVPSMNDSIYECKIIQFTTTKEDNIVFKLTAYESLNLISILTDPTYSRILFECYQKLAENKHDLVRFSLGFEKRE